MMEISGGLPVRGETEAKDAATQRGEGADAPEPLAILGPLTLTSQG